MSKTDYSEKDLEKALKKKDRCVVLFYASWCPFSQRFLPIFERFAQKNPQGCLRIKIDDKAALSERYAVDVVPTVILFIKGSVAKRLDGAPGAGLEEKQLLNLT